MDNDWACLSGHVHLGTIAVPFLTSLLFRLAGHPYLSGHHRVGGNHLYVSRGLGYGSWPISRFRAPPELTLIELVDAASGDGVAQALHLMHWARHRQ